MLQRRPSCEAGYINLSKVNYRKMVGKMETEEDVDTMFDAYVQYIAHKNLLPHHMVDSMLVKSAELGYASKLNEMWKLHRYLLYWPSISTFNLYHTTHKATNTLTDFFNSGVKDCNYITKSSEFYIDLINESFASDDHETVIAAYLDILDHSTIQLDLTSV